MTTFNLMFPLFNKCKTDDMLERNSMTVTLHDLDPSALGNLIDYAYSGEITLTEDNVQVRNMHT